MTDAESNILSIVILIIVGLGMRYLFRASKSNIIEEEGKLILRPNKLYASVGILTIIIGLVLEFIYLLPGSKLNQTAFILPWMATFFTIPGFYLFTHATRHWIEVSNGEIISYSFWRRPRRLSLKNIKKFSFSKGTLFLTLSDDINSIRIHMHLLGFQSFIKKIENMIPKEVIMKIDEVYKNALPNEKYD